ncbi:MAG TPA: valine--tRNA ligase, partial [Leucothrix sp.]|nr:valine--tRNA ligase [Leucothrix sp.]
SATAKVSLSLADRWILSLLQAVTAEVTEHLETYRFDLASKALYEFTWGVYCDWYLELSKPVLFNDNGSDEAKRGTRQTLVRVFETILRLQHPIMPYITEEIWQTIKPLVYKNLDSNHDTIMLQPYPVADDSLIDTNADEDLDWVKNFIVGIRKIRSEMDIPPSKPLPILLQNWTDSDKQRFEDNAIFINSLAKIESAQWLAKGEEAPDSATALCGEMQILIPLAGLIDKDAETARLNKEIEKIQKGLAGVEGRLSNPNFTDKAPADVVAQVRKQAEEQKVALAQLEQQLIKILAM